VVGILWSERWSQTSSTGSVGRADGQSVLLLLAVGRTGLRARPSFSLSTVRGFISCGGSVAASFSAEPVEPQASRQKRSVPGLLINRDEFHFRNTMVKTEGQKTVSESEIIHNIFKFKFWQISEETFIICRSQDNFFRKSHSCSCVMQNINGIVTDCRVLVGSSWYNS
jgi:hypothetical protein